MSRSGVVLACVVLLLVVAMAGAAPKPKPKRPRPPPPPPKTTPKIVKCPVNRVYKACSGMQMTCPAVCPRSCFADCASCKPICLCNKPGGICDDPRFTGGDGITFYFHGKKGRDFCLLSDSDLHINAHFIGRRGTSMTRDFTWVQSIAVLFDDHRIYIGAQKTATWDDAVDRLTIHLDGSLVYLPTKEGSTWQSVDKPALIISRSSDTNEVTVEVEGRFKITANVVPITEEESRVHGYGVTDDDCLAHLELGFKFYSLSSHVDGVLGQTYREDYVSKVKLSANNPVMGGEKKFSSSDIFAADCSVSRFGRGDGGIVMPQEPSDVTCASGIGGNGIVCKK